MAENINKRAKQRLLIASGLMWKKYDIPLVDVLKTLKWMNAPMQEYYKGLIDWVEDYENASEY